MTYEPPASAPNVRPEQYALELLVKLTESPPDYITGLRNLNVDELLREFGRLGYPDVDLPTLQQIAEDFCDRQVCGYNDWNDTAAQEQWRSLSRQLLGVASETVGSK